EGKQVAADYEKRRVEATEGILDAAGNITYGEAEKGPLRRLLGALGPYEGAVARALVLHARGDREGALAGHREADRLMQQVLLPAADDLDRANRDELDRAYASIRRSSLLELLVVVLAGLALLAALVTTQWFLYRRMRRLVNPGLAAATLLAAA